MKVRSHRLLLQRFSFILLLEQSYNPSGNNPITRLETIMRAVAGVFFVAALFTVASFADAQPPAGGGQPGKGKGFGGFPKAGTILSTFVQDTLKMSDDQKKQLADLQKDVDEKLAKILNEDQMKQLKEMQDRPFGGFGGGKGGFGKGGNKGDNKGDKKDEKGDKQQ
jgi:TolA-binding protein